MQNIILEQFLPQMEKTPSRRQQSTGVQVNASSKIGLKHIKKLSGSNVAQSFVPFVFRNKKRKQVQVANQPAPGQYETKSNFHFKNQRDYLEQEFNVVLENSKKVKQSVFFKSTAKRFNYKQDTQNIGLPPSFRLSEHSTSQYRPQPIGSRFKTKNKTITIMNQHKVYPSIPDKSIKFGYSLGQKGKLQKICKSDNQLLKQRQDMKQYIKRQKIEQGYNYMPSNVELVKQKQSLLVKMKQKAHEELYKNNERVSACQQGKSKQIKKPLKLSNSKCNESKIKKILQQKEKLENSLGPGCYQVKYDEKRLYMKPQRYQFFSSSSQRFPQFSLTQQTEKEDVKDILKKNQIQKKIADARKIRSNNFRKCLKRSDRISRSTDRSAQPRYVPGPGDYEPNQKFVKIDVGKTPAFNKSSRFDEIRNIKEDYAVKSLSVTLWKMQSDKQNMMRDLQERVANKNKQKYTQIMKKNKELIQKNKYGVQESLRKNKLGNNANDIEICCWENRPLSRNYLSSKQKQLY